MNFFFFHEHKCWILDILCSNAFACHDHKCWNPCSPCTCFFAYHEGKCRFPCTTCSNPCVCRAHRGNFPHQGIAGSKFSTLSAHKVFLLSSAWQKLRRTCWRTWGQSSKLRPHHWEPSSRRLNPSLPTGGLVVRFLFPCNVTAGARRRAPTLPPRRRYPPLPQVEKPPLRWEMMRELLPGSSGGG